MAVIAITIVAAGFSLFRTDIDWKRVALFASISLFGSIVFIVGDRITSVKIPGGGAIEAEINRATVGADHIADIEKDVRAQSASIAAVVQDATRAKEEIARLDGLAKAAKEKEDEINESLERASKLVGDLKQLSEFNLLLTRAANDDRLAFDEVIRKSEGADEPFKTMSARWLISQTSTDFLLVGGMGTNELLHLSVPFYIDRATIAEYRGAILKNNSDVATTILGALWAQERFSKYDRLTLVVDVIKTTESIRVLTDACRIVSNESKIKLNIVRWKQYPEWWDKVRSDYSKSASVQP